MQTISKEEYDKIFMQPGGESIVRYFDETLSPLFGSEFGFKKAEKGHIWYGCWNNDCRPVIYLYAAKGIFYYLRWGYNFSFIPEFNRQEKFVWHRTDKAIKAHIYDEFDSYIDTDSFYEGFHNSLLDHCYILSEFALISYANETERALEQITLSAKRNIPFMKEWFERVRTKEDVLIELDKQIPKASSLTVHNQYWAKAFLLAYLARQAEAEEALSLYYRGREPHPKVLEKLKATSAAYTPCRE